VNEGSRLTPLDPAFQERLRAIPIFALLPFKLSLAEKGEVEMTLPYKQEYDGIFQSLHGGFLMTLADTAACVSVLTLAGHGAPITTTDMNIRFLSACKTDATARAKVIKFGKSLVPVHIDIFDAKGTLVAVSQVTYMRLRV
jgi:uncharacterized protein (TIGR00369 family)